MGSAAPLEVICKSFSCAHDIGQVILDRLSRRSFAARSTILLQIDKDQNVYLLLAGRAQAVAYSADGNLLLLHIFNAGDVFGETAIFGLRGANHDVIAMQKVEAGIFSASTFVSLMERYSCVALTVSRLLTERLSLTTRRMVEMSTLSATGRIHAELLRRARATPDLTLRPIPVLAEFALHVHSTRETVSRAINELERRGIIRRDAGELRIVAPHRLEELIF